jgi:hypothetical protein
VGTKVLKKNARIGQPRQDSQRRQNRKRRREDDGQNMPAWTGQLEHDNEDETIPDMTE